MDSEMNTYVYKQTNDWKQIDRISLIMDTL